MTPTMIQVFRLDDAPNGRERWSWEVTFADRGLNLDGIAHSFASVQHHINAAIENAEETP